MLETLKLQKMLIKTLCAAQFLSATEKLALSQPTCTCVGTAIKRLLAKGVIFRAQCMNNLDEK